MDALAYIIRTLATLYIITFMLRLILQWVRADFRNPLSQFVLTITNPLVMPLRRMVPPMGGFDTATLLVVVLLEMVLTFGLTQLSCAVNPNFIQLFLLTFINLTELVLYIYLFVIFVYVLLSWVSSGGYNPVAHLLSAIAEPVLRPLRNFIPPIGGIDLSPLFALIAIQALTILLPSAACPGIGKIF